MGNLKQTLVLALLSVTNLPRLLLQLWIQYQRMLHQRRFDLPVVAAIKVVRLRCLVRLRLPAQLQGRIMKEFSQLC